MSQMPPSQTVLRKVSIMEEQEAVNKTFTNTVDKDVPTISMDELRSTMSDIRDSMSKTFRGLSVRVDKELTGFSYYISVSPLLLAALEERTTAS